MMLGVLSVFEYTGILLEEEGGGLLQPTPLGCLVPLCILA